MQLKIAKKIRKLRLKNGLKQDDLAELLNISRAQVCNIEKGRSNLSINHLEKLSKYFNVNITYFLNSNKTSTLELLESAAEIFNNKNLINDQKDELYNNITNIYLASKEK